MIGCVFVSVCECVWVMSLSLLSSVSNHWSMHTTTPTPPRGIPFMCSAEVTSTSLHISVDANVHWHSDHRPPRHSLPLSLTHSLNRQHSPAVTWGLSIANCIVFLTGYTYKYHIDICVMIAHIQGCVFDVPVSKRSLLLHLVCVAFRSLHKLELIVTIN